MIIKKIEVKGDQKVTAMLEFEHGLNVVAGASDTGKSYVIQCLQFIFGATEAPKPIKESKGYEYLEVTFQEDDGTNFRLQRKLTARASTLLMQDGSDEIIVLKGKHRKGIENLSNRFLGKFGLNDKFLLKSKQNLTTQALSLRTLENIFVIDETRIVASYSPLGTGQRGEKTLETSLLSTLLTGMDDADAKELRIANESKSVLEKKMVSLEELINKLYPSKGTDGEVKDQIDDEIASLGEQLERADAALYEIVSLNNMQLDRRSELLNAIGKADDQEREELVLISRFQLLKTKYDSDKARLLSISEAADVLESYTQIACPTCGHAFDDFSACGDIDQIFESANAEAHKIVVQSLDLSKAISELGTSLTKLSSQLSTWRKELFELNASIHGNLRIKIAESNQLKEDLFEKRFERMEVRVGFDARNKALIELGSLRTQAGAKQASYEINTFENEVVKLVSEINLILKRWGYPEYFPTTFSVEDRDIIIGGTPRAHFGKGYRAVAFSAFVIGLMVTLSRCNRHPGFVVLDSPLTTYKKADMDRGDTDESVEADMMYSFYRDLCDSYKQRQIIVFDNQEPDVDLLPMMNYEHFSKNRNVGRYGFFPSV